MKRVEVTSSEWFELKDLFEEMGYFIYELNPGKEAESGEGYDKQGRNIRWLIFLKSKLLNIHKAVISTLSKENDKLYWAKYEMQYFNDFERKIYFLDELLEKVYPDKEHVLWGINGIKNRFNHYDIWDWYSKPFEDYLGPLFELKSEILNKKVIIFNNGEANHLEVV